MSAQDTARGVAAVSSHNAQQVLEAGAPVYVWEVAGFGEPSPSLVFAVRPYRRPRRGAWLMAEAGYAGLFLSAFLAATLIPLSSEAVLAALTGAHGFDLAMLVLVATAGNTLGAAVNWVLGRYCLHWRNRRWFPIEAARLDAATGWFRRYGVWSLLFAWLPVVGDPLTFAAGLLGVRFPLFLLLVAVGKGARYVVVALLAAQALG